MSPDNIFAAQMWTWPDPMIKRDESGRILFLNAAFLSLYGGRVEDWQGSTVMGWPAPQMSQYPNRFETRLPTEQGEFVFDWIECAMGEGQALAIARDVTTFISVAPAAPVEDAAFAPAQDQGHAHYAAEPEQEEAAYAPETPSFETATEAYTPAEPAVQTNPHHAPDPASEPQGMPVPETALAAPAAPVAERPAEPAPPARERDMERRALPIENQDAVLGTNWRDAVIARAVSSEEAENLDTQTAETPQESPVPAQQTPGTGHRILLAEDNAINALLTRTLLEAEGCHVDVVEDGALAVEAVKNASYDMIFMDMRMPNMDGLEATRKIRAQSHSSGSLPIIALTANAFDDDRNACFDSGMNDFMTKPVSAEELSAMVATWAAHKQAA